jgi:transposase
LRQLTRVRSGLVETGTRTKIKIIGILDQIFPEYQELFSDIFGTSSQALLAQSVIPETIDAIPTKKLTALLKKASRGRLGEKKAQKIKQKAHAIGITMGIDAFSFSLEILLAQIKHLDQQIKKLDKEIAKRVKKREETLTSIPGIGITQEAVILAEIGNFDRFKNDKNGAEKLVAIAGIDPKIKESGRYTGKAKMSKRGSGYLRQTIRQASFIAAVGNGKFKDPMFSKIYEKKLAEGKPFEVALSHVENKMLHVIYSLLKSKKKYVPVLTKQ